MIQWRFSASVDTVNSPAVAPAKHSNDMQSEIESLPISGFMAGSPGTTSALPRRDLISHQCCNEILSHK